jgi:hypothetical protein
VCEFVALALKAEEAKCVGDDAVAETRAVLVEPALHFYVLGLCIRKRDQVLLTNGRLSGLRLLRMTSIAASFSCRGISSSVHIA